MAEDNDKLKQLLKVCDRLKNTPDFNFFIEYLVDRLQFLREQSDEIMEDRVWRTNQGARAEIKRILKFVTAPDEIQYYIDEQEASQKAQEILGGSI